MGKLLKFISHRDINTHCVLDPELKDSMETRHCPQEIHSLVEVIDTCYRLNVSPQSSYVEI